MVELHVTVKGEEEVRAKIRATEPEEVGEHMARETGDYMLDQIRANAAGTSMASAFDTVVSGLSAEVRSFLPYAPFIEYGRRAGKMPPIDALMHYSSDPYPIARAIAQSGIRGKYVFTNALHQTQDHLDEIVHDGVREIERRWDSH